MRNPKNVLRTTGSWPNAAVALEQLGPLGPGEAADVQRERVDQPEGLARHLVPEREPGDEPLVEELGGPPQGRRLAHERRPVDAGEGRELPPVVAAEEPVDALVGVEAEELAGQLHRQHFAVVRGRGRAAAAEPARVQRFVLAVHEVEQVQQVVVKRHGLLREYGCVNSISRGGLLL